MSCNGCRVLRKGCSDDCMLRHCLQWIENPQAQGHATLFVAKFFGRATLMSFLSSVPTNQRSALFGSLLYEAVGRSINPVYGAVGLLWTGNWHLCQLGVEKVLQGGALSPLPDQFFDGAKAFKPVVDCCSTHQHQRSRMLKRKVAAGFGDVNLESFQAQAGSPERVVLAVDSTTTGKCHQDEKQRTATPSRESETTTTFGTTIGDCSSERKLLRLLF